MIRRGLAAGAIAVLVGLAGCGGGTGSVGSAAGARGLARFDVDAVTGKVTITKLSDGRAVYGGAAVSFSSSDLLSVGGDAGKRLVRVHAANNSGETWGAAPVNLAVSDLQTAGVSALRENVRVVTFAGNGLSGAVDGYRTGAQFGPPGGIAVGQGPLLGSLIVADRGNHVIRQIDADGMVRTIAGAAGTAGATDGPGTSARFNGPGAVSVDGSGSIFVADQVNNKIRRISPLGEVSTVAGTGALGLGDGSGDAATFSAPTGLASSADGTRVYVTCGDSNQVRLLRLTGSRRDQAASYTVSTVAGSASGLSGNVDGVGAAARFYLPWSVTLYTDAAGAEVLFVADASNHEIRRIDSPAGASPRVVTIAGTGASGSTDGPGSAATLKIPRATAISPQQDGSLVVYECESSLIRAIVLPAGSDPLQRGNYFVRTVAGGDVQGWADGNGSTARFAFPFAAATVPGAGPGATLYVADTYNNRIRTVTVPGGALHSGGAIGGASADSVRMMNGDRETPNGTGWTRTLTPSSSGYDADVQFFVPSGVSGFSFTASVETDSNMVNVPASGAAFLTTIAGDGRHSYRDGLGKFAEFAGPCGIVAVPPVLAPLYRVETGRPIRAFIADTDNCCIRYIDSSGQVGTFAGSGVMGMADGIGAAAQFAIPMGIGLGPDGSLWVADQVNHRIRRVFPNGTVITAAGSGSIGSSDGAGDVATFANVTGLCVDPAGVVYATDIDFNVVRKIRLVSGDPRAASSYRVTTVAGLAGSAGTADGTGPTARFNQPFCIAADRDGRIYVTDNVTGRLRVLTSSSADAMSVTTLATGLSVPYGIALDPAHNAYVCEGGRNSIRRVSPSGAQLDIMAGLGFADGQAGSFNQPFAITMESTGTILVADSGNCAIRALQRYIDQTPLP